MTAPISHPAAVSCPQHARKHILALDGGGIRGVFSIEVLFRIEELLRERRKDPNLVLADHFDFIAGTSTGAIIGAMLSWGEPVSAIREKYRKQSAEVFRTRPLWEWTKSLHDPESLSAFLRDIFHDPETGEPALLRTGRLRTLLMLCMQNASTGSAWPITNNPQAMFNQGDETLPPMQCNLNIPLWQLVRASTAAPLFFPPERITMSEEKVFNFIDGGMTAFNNPALIALLAATLPPYRIEWPPGRHRLHLTSIGTLRIPARYRDGGTILGWATKTPSATIDNCTQEQDMLCRVLGDCVYGPPIDLEAGSLLGDGLLKRQEKKLTYVRYDKVLEDMEAREAMERGLGGFEMNNTRLVPLLAEIGERFAREHVRKEHLFGYTVGFSGNRQLPDSGMVARVLKAEIRRLTDEMAGPLTAISSIACGADTIFAEEVLAMGIPWRALLPFPQEEFMKDFEPRDWERALVCLTQAAEEQIGIDSDGKGEAFRSTNNRIVEESDVIVVVWDGKPARGQGGTAETAARARELRKPLIWVNSGDGAVVRERFQKLDVTNS